MEMDFFYQLYKGVERLAPSSAAETCRALQLLLELPKEPQVLEIGCGNGAQTLVLAEQLGGQIIAVDNHRPFLDHLRRVVKERNLKAEVIPQQASMFDLPYAEQSFDLIWSEGAIYIIGFAEGLKRWRTLLKPSGYLVVTDMVWLQDKPPREIYAYWQANNPNMPPLRQRLAEARTADGYRLIDHFTLPSEAWREKYYRPLREKIAQMRQELARNKTAEQVFRTTEEEADMYDRFGDWYGYEFFILQKEKP